MNNKEKDILAMFNELNSMLCEVMGDYNKLLAENIELKKTINRYRNDPNVMFEPSDEEVTKTFMDAQTNAKDIEFDGDKLVDSVEEAASKLKYFNATTGKWYNAVLMQKDPEILALKNTESKLKSIKEHNNRFTKEISFSTGIACPKCGSELMYVDQNLLLSSPPQRRVQCSKCNHIDYILV